MENMSEVFYVIVLSIGSILTIFILTKLMGYRQMSQMSMFDYIIGISIGSIAAEMSTSLEDNFIQPLVAMVVYAFSAILLSWLCSKSIRIRRLVEGKPLILLSNGEIYRDNLRKSKIDVSEFLEQCRLSGYFDVSKLQTAVLESNGKISFLPKSTDRPVIPTDLSVAQPEDYMVANVVLDGKILRENLRHTGNDEKWLHSQIRGQGAKRIEDILLATCDSNNKVSVYMINNKKKSKDILL